MALAGARVTIGRGAQQPNPPGHTPEWLGGHTGNVSPLPFAHGTSRKFCCSTRGSARRDELRFPLPVGVSFVYDDEGAHVTAQLDVDRDAEEDSAPMTWLRWSTLLGTGRRWEGWFGRCSPGGRPGRL